MRVEVVVAELITFLLAAHAGLVFDFSCVIRNGIKENHDSGNSLTVFSLLSLTTITWADIHTEHHLSTLAPLMPHEAFEGAPTPILKRTMVRFVNI